MQNNIFLKKYILDFLENGRLKVWKHIKNQEKKWLKLLINCIEPKSLNPDSKEIFFKKIINLTIRYMLH